MSSTDCDCLDRRTRLEVLGGKNESFPGVNWFAGNLPGTEASSMQ